MCIMYIYADLFQVLSLNRAEYYRGKQKNWIEVWRYSIFEMAKIPD